MRMGESYLPKTPMSTFLPVPLISRPYRMREILIGYDSWRPPTRHYDPEFRSSSWGSKPSSRCSSTTSHWARFRTGILHTQLGVPISISIPSIDRIICIPKRREQRTPYQSTPSGQRLDILSPSIPCRQSLETIYHKIYGVQQGGV